MVPFGRYTILFCTYCRLVLSAQSFSGPAGLRPAHRHNDMATLPGGRVIAPLGEQHITGAGPFGLAVSASGKTILSANTGPGRNSLSILQYDKGYWQVNHWAARTRDNDAEDGELAGWR